MIKNTIYFLEKKRKEKTIHDKFLVEFFQRKQLPFELDSTDRIFYSLCRNPTVEIINEIQKKYKEMVKQIEKKNQDDNNSDTSENEDM